MHPRGAMTVPRGWKKRPFSIDELDICIIDRVPENAGGQRDFALGQTTPPVARTDHTGASAPAAMTAALRRMRSPFAKVNVMVIELPAFIPGFTLKSMTCIVPG